MIAQRYLQQRNLQSYNNYFLNNISYNTSEFIYKTLITQQIINKTRVAR